MNEIGSYLRRALKKRNMKQKELALALQMTPEHISKICLNKVSPSMEALIHICEVLDMSFSEFFVESKEIAATLSEDEASFLHDYRRLSEYEKEAIRVLAENLYTGKRIHGNE